ncbi:class I SAM-dependent methyltransferase [Flavobacteriaceae bacterium S0825]|uniref:methyltransferase domain-containing protein n=1 Tax=Gaetbulibacter sp. S0825 TaxID=2720084 RepID=UPI001431F1C5|nr:methyltransferase domain-containing protein [Gaetbulibacter sp. S0825]MCK0107695.1 class I SAM-dependent methyltransferase [Flavobacteriaceae bacterium S0825]NIX63331.1 class I SAM-dependent methyltransferase [Gaetbulibacter sp. S0825]
MIDNSMFFERFLQNYRFKKVKKYLIGDVLDFGGNEGELKKFVKGKYLAINYDHSKMEATKWDTITSLAVIEHIEYEEVFEIHQKFKTLLKPKGRIFLTTPTKIAKPVLELLAFLNVIDKTNIGEHKHYWNKKEIYYLAEKTGFTVSKYRKFQFGFNQFAILTHK